MVTDKIGQEIKPGVIIAYGHALGRCAGIRIGKVLKVVSKTVPHHRPETEYRITVRGIEDDWKTNKPKLTERNGTLQFPSRIIVLPQIPDDYHKLLDGIEVLDEN